MTLWSPADRTPQDAPKHLAALVITDYLRENAERTVTLAEILEGPASSFTKAEITAGINELQRLRRAGYCFSCHALTTDRNPHAGPCPHGA